MCYKDQKGEQEIQFAMNMNTSKLVDDGHGGKGETKGRHRRRRMLKLQKQKSSQKRK